MRINLNLEAACQSGCKVLLLPAFGCGAYGNPPQVVAELFREALRSQGGGIERVTICILDDHNTGRRQNRQGNFEPFAEAFRGDVIAAGMPMVLITGTVLHQWDRQLPYPSEGPIQRRPREPLRGTLLRTGHRPSRSGHAQCSLRI